VEGEIIKALAGMSAGAKGIWLFGSILVSGQLLKWVAEWRAWRQLPPENKQANREGFTAQVSLLTKQVVSGDAEARRLRAEIATLYEKLRKRDEDREDDRRLCREETEGLRRQILGLENELAGLQRRLSAEAIAVVRAKGEPSADVTAAAERAAGHLEGGGDRPIPA
jgi:hypothetical protein